MEKGGYLTKYKKCISVLLLSFFAVLVVICVFELIGNFYPNNQVKITNDGVCVNVKLVDRVSLNDNDIDKLSTKIALSGDTSQGELGELVRVANDSIMFDYSRMFDNSAMYDNSVMYNNSELKNNDKLYSKLVSRVDAFIEISNPEGRLVTCVKKGNKILYNIGCQDEIDEETFKYRIEHEDGSLEQNPHRIYYYKIIEMAKLYFGVK